MTCISLLQRKKARGCISQCQGLFISHCSLVPIQRTYNFVTNRDRSHEHRRLFCRPMRQNRRGNTARRQIPSALLRQRAYRRCCLQAFNFSRNVELHLPETSAFFFRYEKSETPGPSFRLKIAVVLNQTCACFLFNIENRSAH